MDGNFEKTKPGTLSMLRSDKNLLLICLAGFVYSIGAGAVWFVLPTIATRFTSDVMLLVTLLSVPYFFSVFMSIPFGGLSDYIGRRAIGIAGTWLMVPVGIMLLYASDIWIFIALGIAFGISNAMLNPISKAYVMDLAPKGCSSEYFGFIFTFIYLGASIGPLIAGFLVMESSFIDPNSLTLLIVLTGLLAPVALILMSETITEKRSFRSGLRKIVMEDKLFFKAVKAFEKLKVIGILIILVTFVTSLVDGIIWTFEPLYYENLGLSPSSGGVIMFLFIMPMILFQIPAGYLADRRGKFGTLCIGLLIAGAGLVIFGLMRDELSLMLTAFLTAIGVAFVGPALSGIVTDNCEKKARGDISGVWSTFMDIPNIVAPFIGGAAVALYGNYGAVFWLLGAIMVISVIPVIVIGRRNHF